MDKHASPRKKASKALYMTETLRKAIMRRSQLEAKYLKINHRPTIYYLKNRKMFAETL